MKVLLSICLFVSGLLVGCGRGPTAPEITSAPPPATTPVATTQPTATPLPCRPFPKCLG